MTSVHDERGPPRLSELSPAQAHELLRANPRLLLPVGTLVVRGAAVPMGADSLIVDRVADDLSAKLRIVRAPTMPFGVHHRADPDSPGSASLTRKTLHRVINELVAAWETEAKVRDFVILTTHTADAHLEALSTIRSDSTVQLIDIFRVARSHPAGDTVPIAVPLLAFLRPDLVSASEPTKAQGRLAYHEIIDGLAAELTEQRN